MGAAVRRATPGLAELLAVEEERKRFIADAHAALAGYFRLEDPRRLEPAEREWYVEAELPSGLRLRGYVDRLDVSAAGDIRVVDYKTGKVPLEAYEASALFQMKFYALVIWRLRGVIPRVLQLMYLSGDGEVLRYSPDEADLRATERKLDALWAAISRARETGDWRPRPSTAVRLVPAQGAVPGVRRDAPAPSRARAAPDGAAARRPLRRTRLRADRGAALRVPAASHGISGLYAVACYALCGLAARDRKFV